MNFYSDLDVREDDNVREELQPYILTQYSASPTITKLLSDFRDEIDTQADMATFEQNMFDIETASGIGLDIWGKIIGISRTIQLSDSTVTLDDEHYRKLLMYKALANITDASLATLNKLLPLLFEDASFSVRNVIIEAKNGDEYYNSYPMHVRYTIDGELSELDAALFSAGGTLSLAAGVGWSLLATQGRVFGFDGSGLQPFNRGTFMNENNIIVGG